MRDIVAEAEAEKESGDRSQEIKEAERRG